MNVKSNLFFQILGWGRGHWALLRYHQVAANTRYYQIIILTMTVQQFHLSDGKNGFVVIFQRYLFAFSPQQLCFSVGKTFGFQCF